MDRKDLKNILIIICITLAVFSNALFNGFAGDDGGLITNNNFYKSLDNFPKIFTKDFLVTNTLDYFGDAKAYDNSGAVSYRPVVAVSLFFDYAIWQLNPLGYHLHNILLHLICVAVAYLLAVRLFRNRSVAFFGSLIFAIHPLKTEAVATIAFRQDIQVGLLILLAFYFYIRCHSDSSKISAALSLICYFFALFAKEIAILFPVMIILYEFFKPAENTAPAQTELKTRLIHNALLWLFTGFYLYIYLYVFPNTMLGQTRLMGEQGYLYHALHIPVIYAEYLWITIFPNFVYTIPGVYYPSIENFTVLHWFGVSAGMIGTILLLVISYTRNRAVCFLATWYLLFYAPVSNILPNPNPMAFRYLYLPSFGSMLILGWGLVHLANFLQRQTERKSMDKLITWGFAGLCAVSTFTLNYDWKNNFSLSKAWVKHYPDHPTGYNFLGLVYLDGRMEHYALPNFMKAVELGSNDPRSYFYAAKLNADLSEDEKVALYKKALKMNPLYASAAERIGRIYYDREQYDDALYYLDYNLALQPSYSTYRFMMLACNALEDRERAKLVIDHAEKHLTDPLEIDTVRQLYENQTKPVN